jgi:ubiquitin-conjugating enzyme E2 J2
MAANNMALSRLRKELKRIQTAPVEHISAVPDESNILEWHYVVTGPQDSPYAGGQYHGKLVFPKQYPYRPPSILMLTPSGRFKPNTRLCLSMSDFHPETWNPLWSVSSILSGLLSFMLDVTPTYGSVESSSEFKLQCAQQSMSFNMKDAQFRALFPDLVEDYQAVLAARGQAQRRLAALQGEVGSLRTAGSGGGGGGGNSGGDGAGAAAAGGGGDDVDVAVAVDNHSINLIISLFRKLFTGDTAFDTVVIAVAVATLGFAASYMYTLSEE